MINIIKIFMFLLFLRKVIDFDVYYYLKNMLYVIIVIVNCKVVFGCVLFYVIFNELFLFIWYWK